MFHSGRKNKENFGQEIALSYIRRLCQNTLRLLALFCILWLLLAIFLVWMSPESSLIQKSILEAIKSFFGSISPFAHHSTSDYSIDASLKTLFFRSGIISLALTALIQSLFLWIGKKSSKEEILDGGNETNPTTINCQIESWIFKWLHRQAKETGDKAFDFFESCDLGYLNKEERKPYIYGKYLNFGHKVENKEEICFPEEFCKQHIGIEGATGTGKTVLINSILEQIRNHHATQTCILDFNGQFYSIFGKKDDVILSINDKRGVKWNPWLEDVAYEKIASGLIEEDPSDKFFAPAARSLLCDLMCLDDNIQDFWKDLTLPQEEIYQKLLKHKLPSANDFVSKSGGQGAGVRRTMTLKLDALLHLNHWTKNSPEFSVIDWAKNGSNKWLFIIVREEDREKATPWIRLWMNLVVSGIMMRDHRKLNNATWLIADEVPLLGKIPSLQEGITNGRKYNFRTVLGYQTEGQIDQVYEKESAGIKNSLRTQFIFNPGDAQSAQRSAANLGKKEIYDSLEQESFSQGKATQSSISNSNQIREKFVVHPEKLRRMDKTECYLRMPLFSPVFLRTPLKNYPVINKPHLCENPPRILKSEAT